MGDKNKHSEGKKKLVQVRLGKRANSNLKALEDLTGVTNKTQLVSTALDLSREILETIAKGGNVICENPDGTRDRLKPIGL